MPLFAGPVLLADRTEDGFVRVEDGRVAEAGWGEPPAAPDARGWICPPPLNAHTHAADAFLREAPKPGTVRELVGPGGWKHRRLAAARPEDLEAGVRRVADEAAQVGTSHFLDFREGGLAGVRFLRGLADDLPVRPFVMGRGAGPEPDGEEVAAVVAEADGVGLSGVRDLRPHVLEAWADACRRARKPFAIHLSEDRRDDASEALALRPRFVVHAVQATDEDLEELAQARVPIVVCPRSNARLGLRPPVPRMLAAGCTVCVGSDNGMLADGNVLQDLAQLRAWFPEIPVEALLRMATHNGRGLLGLPAPLPPRVGAAPDLVVLPPDPVPRGDRGKPRIEVPAAPAPPPAPPAPPGARPAPTGPPGSVEGA